MSPSTHSADVSQIQTDTTAILVDTGTTLPATLSGLRDNAVKFAGGNANASNNSSLALADTGMSITTPDVDGKTYTIVLYQPGAKITDLANTITFAWNSPSTGTGASYHEGPAAVANFARMGQQNAEAGFAANELVKIQWMSQTNTEYVSIMGPWAMMAYEEA